MRKYIKKRDNKRLENEKDINRENRKKIFFQMPTNKENAISIKSFN